MSQQMNDYLHDPATGRRLTREERLARLDQKPVQPPPLTSLPAGTVRDRLTAMKQRDEIRAEIAERVKAKAAENAPPVNPFAERVSAMIEARKHCAPHEREAIDRRLGMYKEKSAEWQKAEDAKAKRAEWAADPTIVLMRENASSLRSIVPDVDPNEVEYLTTLATTDDLFSSPAEQTQAYWSGREKLLAKQYAADDAKMAALDTEGLEFSQRFQAQKQKLADTAAAIQQAKEAQGEHTDAS